MRSYLQGAILQVADPKRFLTLVERQHRLHSVDEELQALLNGWNVGGQADVPLDLISQRAQTDYCEHGANSGHISSDLASSEPEGSSEPETQVVIGRNATKSCEIQADGIHEAQNKEGN